MALAKIGCGIPGLTFVEVQDDHARALLGEEARGPTANSARGCRSRDDADLIG